MWRFSHLDVLLPLRITEINPQTPKDVSLGCTGQAHEGKNVVKLMKTAPFFWFSAYFTFSNSVKCFSNLIVTRTELGGVEPRRRPKPHEDIIGTPFPKNRSSF
jgi:hypothetical protein